MDPSSVMSVFHLFFFIAVAGSVAIDEHGYVMFCPCMGKFASFFVHSLPGLTKPVSDIRGIHPFT